MAVQRSRLTMKQLRDRVKGDLGLRSSNLIQDEDIDAWGVDAQTEIAEITHWYRTSTSVSSTADTALYDLPTDCLALEEVWHNDLPLCPIRLVDFYRTHPNWRQDDSGTPTHWYVRGMTAYGLHPAPDATVANAIDLFYTALPPTPTLNTDTYYIPTALSEALVCYCKMRASEKDATGEGGRRFELYRNEWEQWKRKAMELVGSVSEGEVTVVGGFGSDYAGDAIDPVIYRTIPAP